QISPCYRPGTLTKTNQSVTGALAVGDIPRAHGATADLLRCIGQAAKTLRRRRRFVRTLAVDDRRRTVRHDPRRPERAAAAGRLGTQSAASAAAQFVIAGREE